MLKCNRQMGYHKVWNLTTNLRHAVSHCSIEKLSQSMKLNDLCASCKSHTVSMLKFQRRVGLGHKHLVVPPDTAGHTICDLPVCPSNQISLRRAVVSHCFIEKHTYIINIGEKARELRFSIQPHRVPGVKFFVATHYKRNHITKGIACQLGVMILHTRVVVSIETSATGHKSRAVCCYHTY